MKVSVYKPNDKILGNLIDCFYILKKSAYEADVKYITFPSLFSILSVTQKAVVAIDETNIRISQNNAAKPASFIVSKFKKPIFFEYKGAVEEITIYFKPLALYSLLDKDLNTFPDGSSFFPYPDFEETLNEILNAKNDEEKINQLEFYLMSKYNGRKHKFLSELIADLHNVNNAEVPLSGLAQKYGISKKTLIKHFERHTCKSPSEFRKIVRFREAMKKYIHSPAKISLTELTYILNFFDQSHLIREFKAITGFTPTYFFKNLTPIEEGKVNWLFLQR